MFFTSLEETVDPSKNTVDKSGNIRADFLFSYWIFAWFVLFYFLDKKTAWGKWMVLHFSPILALWFGFIYDFLSFLSIFFLNPDPWILIKYFIMLCFIKILPLYLLYNMPIHWFSDTLALIGLFLVYLVYLHANDSSVTEVYAKTERAILSGENKTPFFQFMDLFS